MECLVYDIQIHFLMCSIYFCNLVYYLVFKNITVTTFTYLFMLFVNCICHHKVESRNVFDCKVLFFIKFD